MAEKRTDKNNRDHKDKRIPIAVKILAGAFLLVILCAAGYVIYMQANYYRIEDHTALETENNAKQRLKTDTPYTAVTYNIGFGAYGPDYSFFMDTGEMEDGTLTAGKYGKAVSRESAETNVKGAAEELKVLEVDFMLLQEVDVDADRSYHMNQLEQLKEEFPDYGNVFANNFHSAYLLYPFSVPHGAVDAGLLSFSRYHIEKIRRALV